MRRLIIFAGRLWAILMLMCGVVVGISHSLNQAPLDIQAYGLDRCEHNIPCFLTIVPGKTPIKAAFTLLNKRILGTVGSYYILEQTGPSTDQITGVTLTTETNTADELDIDNIQTPLALASLIALYGLPCKVVETEGINFSSVVAVVFPQFSTGVRLIGHRLAFNSTLTWINFHAPIDSSTDELSTCKPLYPKADSINAVWRGFAALNHYQ